MCEGFQDVTKLKVVLQLGSTYVWVFEVKIYSCVDLVFVRSDGSVQSRSHHDLPPAYKVSIHS